MRVFAASALIALSGLAGAFSGELALAAPAAADGSSAGSNGDGDHMSGNLTNKDQVTSTGPNLGTGALRSAEKAAGAR